MKQSAGVLFYRQGPGGLEVLLVHPSGNYNRHAPWGIPKGLPDEGETLEQAAHREAREEAGVVAGAALVPLGSIDYTKSHKRVHCFAAEAPDTVPSCACWEIDRAEYVPLEQARERIHPEQRPFLDRLTAWLESGEPQAL
jgi:predicted NUDIX family NTP pyrophosphohydrolase